MQIYVLDDTYSPVFVIDSFTSLIWTKRFFDCGDFELYMPADKKILDYIHEDSFLIRDDDDSVMVVERFRISTDAENGDYFIFSGRSLESILYRRIFREQFIVSDTTINSAVQKMATECTTTNRPSETYRKIPGLTVDTENIIEKKISCQFTGQTLLDGIVSICQPDDIGIKMVISGQNLILSFYKGQENGVIFSTEFDNIISSAYEYDITNYATYLEIAGEGEGKNRRYAGIFVHPIYPTYIRDSGLKLREKFVDARDISSNDGEIETYDYDSMLIARGREKVSEYEIVQTFECEVEPRIQYVYKRDYSLGDIVKVENDYGVQVDARITEIIESWDNEGYRIIPKIESTEQSMGHIVLTDKNRYILKDSNGYILTVQG
jgi:hypothetical protein